MEREVGVKERVFWENKNPTQDVGKKTNVGEVATNQHDSIGREENHADIGQCRGRGWWRGRVRTRSRKISEPVG
eukprot:3666711-Pyramimonas_sp.AAC.1